MDDYDYGKYENYTYEYVTHQPVVLNHHKSCFAEASCTCAVVLVAVICLLGVVGNGIVIWIAGLKMKKTVNIVWYLSLAISDFTFCVSLPITAVYMATREWIFGVFMCKFTSFIMFLNMFSSIFLLVVISVDRCVSVVMPVWAQNHRTVKKASVVVTLAW
ncbi:chemokine-like receptor 1 isoform X1, partial [Arapaima gigas]